MMRKYPKLPTGPSSLGAAAVRALDQRGGNFQVSFRDTQTVARVAGEFSRVTTGGFEYVIDGRVTATPNTRRTFVCPDYRTVFIPGFSDIGTQFLGAGNYFGAGPEDRTVTSQVFSYPVDGTARTAVGNMVRSVSPISGVFLNVLGGRNFRGAVDFAYDTFDYPTLAYRPVTALNPAKAYLRRTTEPADKLLFSPFVVPGDTRIDVAGRVLPDLALVVWGQTSDTVGARLTLGRIDVEFTPFIPCVTTDTFGAFILQERFFWNEAFDGGKDYRPQIRLIRINGKNPSALSVFNLTNTLNNEAYVPEPSPGNPLVPGLEADYFAWTLAETRFCDALHNDAMSLMRLCAISGDRFLLSYTAPVLDPGWSTVDYRYRFKMFRIDLNTLSVVSLIDEALTGTPGASNATHRHIESMLHLGGDVVLAKRIAGWKGVDHAVTFMLSMDGGTSWSDLAPTGLEAPLLNQYLGQFTLHRPHVPGLPPSPPTVLLPAWSTTAQAYYVFESLDYGATWQRRAKIATPDAFYRVDNMISGDGGPNFNLLLPGTNVLRVPDLAAPNRYNQ